jgi:hypothetical protein
MQQSTVSMHQEALHPNRYERTILAPGSLFHSLVAGAAKSARLSRAHSDPVVAGLWEAGAGLVGPVFFFFTLWALERARDLGLKRLYFISRDSQIHLRIAHTICERWGFEIECRYLYGSTSAWRFPLQSRQELRRRIESFVADPGTSLQTLLELLKVEGRQDVQEMLGELRLRGEGALDIGAAGYLRAYLLSDSFLDSVHDESRKQLSAASEYLHQEGLTSKISFGFVPFLWSGRSLGRLRAILDRTGVPLGQEIVGFYYCLVDRIELENAKLLSFLGPRESELMAITSEVVSLLELLASADHATVRAYECREGRWHPKLKGDGRNTNLDLGLKFLHDGVLAFADEFTRIARPEDTGPGAMRDPSIHNLRLFMEQPSRLEAEVFGRFHFSSVSEDVELREISPKLTVGQILAFLVGRRIYRNRGVIWIQGSFSRSMGRQSEVANWLLNKRQQLGAWRRRLTGKFKS